MDAVIRPSAVAGEVTPPPSKSDTHRYLIASALADGGHIDSPLDSADTRTTGHALDALGAQVDWSDGYAKVTSFHGGRPSPASKPIDCANSGTTLRFACGLCALTDGTSTLTGDSSLRRRPNGPLLDAIVDLGGTAESEPGDGTAPLVIGGPMRGGHVTIPGSVSSQFVSSLLFAGGLTDDGIGIDLSSSLISRPYAELTKVILGRFGIEVTTTSGGYHVAGGQRFTSPSDGITIDADPTAVSYLLAAGVLAGDDTVTVTDVGRRGAVESPILDLLEQMGIGIERDGQRGTVAHGEIRPGQYDLAEAPDLLPTIAVLAGLADGTSTIVNIEHARYKETDRIAATADFLRHLGVPVTERPDGLLIRGQPEGLSGGSVDSRGDHRIAMAAAVAGLIADGPVTIRGADCVEVSFPRFFETLEALGASVTYPA